MMDYLIIFMVLVMYKCREYLKKQLDFIYTKRYKKGEVFLKGIIVYLEDYLNNKLKIRTYLICMKYHTEHTINKSHYLVLKNIIRYTIR